MSSTVTKEPNSGFDKEYKQHTANDNHSTHSDSSPTSIASHKDEEANQKPALAFDPSEYPDGGAKAWMTVAGASACFFVSFGWINCVGVFQEYYASHQLKAYSQSTIAWIPSLQVFFMLFGGSIVGSIFDNYGPRFLLIGGTFLHVFGLMMTSISKEYYQLLLSQGVCSAIGASMVFYPSMNCVPTWFFAKRGAAFGAAAAGSSLGGVLFPIMVSHMIPEIGFGWTIRVCAFLILALLIFANLTVRSRIPPRPRPFQLMAFVRPLGELKFALLTAAIFFFFWGMFIPFTFIVVEAQAYGMSTRLAVYLVSILNAASIFGRTVPNIIADKLAGRYNVMVVMAFFTSILILAVWMPVTNNAGMIVFAALFGIGSGAGIGLTPALCASISDIKEIGIRTGTIFAFAAIAGLTGSPIGGAILARGNGDFHYVQAFGGVSCFVGACLFLACRISIAGFKITKV